MKGTGGLVAIAMLLTGKGPDVTNAAAEAATAVPMIMGLDFVCVRVCEFSMR
jgi:hypothetical protein